MVYFFKKVITQLFFAPYTYVSSLLSMIGTLALLALALAILSEAISGRECQEPHVDFLSKKLMRLRSGTEEGNGNISFPFLRLDEPDVERVGIYI